MIVFIESDLLQRVRDVGAIDLVDDAHPYVHSARRLFLTAWLLSGGTAGELSADACGAAVRFWNARKGALHSWRRVTITTLLFDLESHGLVESFEETAGGFNVLIQEAEAA